MIKVNKIKIMNNLISKCTDLKTGKETTRMELTKLKSDIKSFVNNVFSIDKEKLKVIDDLPLYYDYIIFNRNQFDNKLENFIGILKSWKNEIELFHNDDEAEKECIDLILNHICFIVHGHNNEMKLEISRFIEKELNKDCIILHEQPNAGRTIQEKFEKHSNVDFAVCIWSADDVLNTVDEEEIKRARQNVILETGFFWGKYGRNKLIIIYEEGVEIPSDYHGVLYIPFKDNWQEKLRKEIGEIYSFES
ncbi:MAG: nucleotide-binding protein [Candidatus Stygibacter australis]|nr:nucleotide-binding protein [Candidatus Stygibacter australis]